jgi:hypothetical protein
MEGALRMHSYANSGVSESAAISLSALWVNNTFRAIIRRFIRTWAPMQRRWVHSSVARLFLQEQRVLISSFQRPAHQPSPGFAVSPNLTQYAAKTKPRNKTILDQAVGSVRMSGRLASDYGKYLWTSFRCKNRTKMTLSPSKTKPRR